MARNPAPISPRFNFEDRYRQNIMTRLGLTIPAKPQSNIDSLILEYLDEQDITGVLIFLKANDRKVLYLDDISKEIYDLYFNTLLDVKDVGRIISSRSGREVEVFGNIDETYDILQSRIDLIEYKIRSYIKSTYTMGEEYLDKISISNRSELLGKRKIQSNNRNKRSIFRVTQTMRNIKNRNLRKVFPSLKRDSINKG
jgi:hypothetical protein